MAKFIFGGDTSETAESIARKRALARSLMSNGPIRTLGDGLNSLGGSIGSAIASRRADNADEANRKDFGEKWADVLGNGNGVDPLRNDVLGALGDAPEPVGGGIENAGVAELAQLIGHPGASKAQSGLVQMLMAQKLKTADPMTAYQAAQLKLAQAKHDATLSGRGGYGKASTNISLTNGGGATPVPAYPKAPTGYMYVRDPQTGQVVISPEGIATMAPIAGGPDARKIAEGQAAEASKNENAARSGGIVTEDIGRLRKLIKSSGALNPVTGLGGAILSAIPQTGAYDANALVETIAGNIGMDRLQQMRDGSKTGGALGAINEKELTMLRAALGNLDLQQSDEQILHNLERIETIYNGIMKKAAAYPNAAEFGFTAPGDPTGGNSGLAVPDDPEIDALLKKYGG